MSTDGGDQRITDVMRAAEFTGDNELKLNQVAIPRPTVGEALVKVAGCGVCGSDKSFVSGTTRAARVTLPVILGHEISGRVVSFGPETERGSLNLGDPVLVYPFIGCGCCRTCERGQGHLCLEQKVIGYHRPGGYAEYVIVPVENLVTCSPDLSLVRASLLVDAFATPYHALARANVTAGDRVLVIGSGGLGMAAVLMRELFQFDSVGVVSAHPDAVVQARDYGADEVFVETSDNGRTLGRTLRRWSRGGVDVVLDTRGTQKSIALALNTVRPGGTVVVVGLTDQVIGGVKLSNCVRRGIQLLGCYGSSRWDVARLVEWAQGDGSEWFSRMDVRAIGLEELPQALGVDGMSIEGGRAGVSRVVVVPNLGGVVG